MVTAIDHIPGADGARAVDCAHQPASAPRYVAHRSRLGVARMRRGRPHHQDLARAFGDHRVHVFSAEPVGFTDEQRLAVLTSEHARKAWSLRLEFVAPFATLAHAEAHDLGATRSSAPDG